MAILHGSFARGRTLYAHFTFSIDRSSIPILATLHFHPRIVDILNRTELISNHIPPLPSTFHEQPEWLRVTLSCIGDGIITTDNRGLVTFLNPVAEALTGWSLADAAGLALESVFHIVNEATRNIVENPAHKALRDGVIVGLANHTLLIAKDGSERPIDDSAAPIRSDSGEVAGVVLIFRDVTQRKQDEQLVHDALAYADNIIATMREPFLVLDQSLKVVTANGSFYDNFHVAKAETQGQYVYDLGNRQWDIPALRTLLEEVLPQNQVFQDFEVEHDFPTLGRKTMLLNARRIRRPGNHSELILLAIEDVTERRLAEQLARDTLAYADNIIATVREPFLVLDQHLKVVTANGSFYNNFQVDQTETQGQFVYDLGNRQWDIPALRTLLEEVLPQNQVFQDFVVEHDFPTLGRKTMLLNARRIRQPGNHAELILLAIEDVTEGLEIEELHRESEARFRGTFENAAIGMAHVGLDGRWLRMNQALCRIIGYSSEELATKTFADITHPDDLDADLENVKRVLAGEIDNYAMEKRYFRKDGSHIFVNLTVSLLRDAAGQPLHFISAVEDISQRKRAEDAQRASDQRMHLAIEATSVGIWEWNVYTGQIHWDAQMFRIYGITPVEDGVVPYSTWAGTVVPDDLPEQERILQETVRSCGRSSRSFRIARAASQDYRHIEAVETVRLNPQGQAEWVVGTNVDVTDRVRVDRLLIAQAQVLELAASGAEFQQVLDLVVSAVREHSGEQCRSSLFFHDPMGLRLRLAAASGLPPGYTAAVEQQVIGPQSPSCGAAAFTGETEIVGDVERDPRWAPLLGLAQEHEIRAVWSEPMRTLSGEVLGTLSLYFRTPREPQPGDLEAIQLLSQTTALVIERNREREQRQRAEDSLRESEKQLRRILDTMPPKIATTQPNGEVDYFNPQWTEYTGLAFDQLKGRGWKQVIHPEDVTEHVRLWRSSIQNNRPFEFESRLRRADGEYRWHISRALPLRDEAGQTTMWVGSNSDIHDIKQAEVAVQVSEVRYRRLFEAAKDGILILDSHNGQIVDANPYMSDLLGYTYEDFIGKEMWEIGLFRDKSTNEAAVRGLQESGYLRYEHMPLLTKAGWQVQVEIVANVYQEDQQKVIQCNIRNITERSQMEELLRNQSVEMSDLHRRKDEFLAMLSHELRSPLAPIANAVQLLGLQPETESLLHKKARDIIQRQLGQMQHLVDDLLEVSRITSGRVQLRKERVSINRIVQGAVETARPLIEQRGHTLTVTILPPPIWLDADPARLEQVIVNLLTNASKYTQEGGQIDLTAQMEGPECVLRVRDNGEGISPTLLPRIFELFTQAERSLDRSQGGLGIGLALVQRLTELHGGTVDVESVLGQGSEFIVRLPLHSDELQQAAGEGDGVLASPQAPLPPQLRVLVVDDNVDTVLSFSMLLQASGHEVRTAHDGLIAMEVALEFRPDVMLLDIGLPGLNGYEVAKQVREHPQLRDVVLVALTGYGQDSDRATSLQAGFNHHMVKPASFEQIKQILASVPRLPR